MTLPSVSGPTSAGPAAFAVAPPRRGVVDELVWESLCYATPTGYRPLFLDLHVPVPPAGHGPMPLVVWVHGGGWESGSRRRFPVAVEEAWFLERVLLAGLAVALVDYRLVREADFPAAPDDVAAAVAWLRDHAAELGYDGSRIVLWGESAGAHLALLAAEATGAAAVVDWYGPTDLPALATTALLGPGTAPGTASGTAPGPAAPAQEEVEEEAGEDAGEEGGEPGFSPDMARVMEERGWAVPESSPVTVLTAGCPPVFIAHGRSDTTVPLAQSETLHTHLQRLGVPVELFETDGGHVFEGADVIPEVIARSLAFLARTLDLELGPPRDPGHAARPDRAGDATSAGAEVRAGDGAGAGHPVVPVEDAVAGPPDSPVRLRIRRPAARSDTVVLLLDPGPRDDVEHARVAARLCATLPATVVQVECRPAVDAPSAAPSGAQAAAQVDHPSAARAAAAQAAAAAVAWAHGMPDRFGARHLVVAGDGAGAGLAFATALHCRDHGIPVAAVLAERPSAVGTGEWPRADLGGLPPTVVGIGAHDVLLEETLRLVRRLRAAGVPTKLRIFPTLGPDYAARTAGSDAADRAVAQLHRDLGQLLRDGTLW